MRINGKKHRKSVGKWQYIDYEWNNVILHFDSSKDTIALESGRVDCHSMIECFFLFPLFAVHTEYFYLHEKMTVWHGWLDTDHVMADSGFGKFVVVTK